MADKIVQLQNKDGDNIYPISRGIAANSVDTAALKDSSVTANKLDATTLGPAVAKTIGFSMNLDKWAGTATVLKAPKNPWVTIIIKATSAYVSAGGYFQVASGLPQPYPGNVDWNGYSSVVNSLGDSAYISYDGKLYIGNTSAHAGSLSSFMRITFLSDSATFNGV